MLAGMVPMQAFAEDGVQEEVTCETHVFDKQDPDAAYLCTKANYDRSAVYYTSCSVCGLSSAGLPEQSTFAYGKPGDGYYSVVSGNQWQTAPGIKERELILNDNDTGTRRQAVHVMEVDVTNPYASILPSYMGMNPTPGNYKLGTMSKQAAWVEKNMGLNVVGAMNTCLSWYDSSYYEQNPDKKYEPIGILIIRHRILRRAFHGRNSLHSEPDPHRAAAGCERSLLSGILLPGRGTGSVPGGEQGKELLCGGLCELLHRR